MLKLSCDVSTKKKLIYLLFLGGWGDREELTEDRQRGKMLNHSSKVQLSLNEI